MGRASLVPARAPDPGARRLPRLPSGLRAAVLLLTGLLLAILLTPLVSPVLDLLAAPSPAGLPGEVSAANHIASSAVARADRSLEAGFGPAAGISVTCTVGEAIGTSSCEGSGSQASVSATGEVSPLAPAKRWGANIAYDGRDQYVVLFSGSSSANDTWIFAHGNWTKLTTPIAPSQRTYAGMTYDAADGYVLLFGGHHKSTIYLNDTWMFAGGRWTDITPKPNDAPSPRAYAAMTYDTMDGYVLLFGGNTSEQFFGDTWKYHDGAWTNITPSTLTPTDSPSPRAFASMAYDATDGYVVLYGGGAHEQALRDTWTFVGGVWKELQPADTPPASYYTMMAFDNRSTDRYLVLFGGIDKAIAVPYTWEFSHGSWTNITLSVSPPARFGASLAYDANDGYLVLFGGISQPVPKAPVLDDTWTYADGNWTPVVPPRTFTATFTESGLPAGTIWSVTVNGTTVESKTTSINFELTNGTFPYEIGSVAGYRITSGPSSGTVIVNGAAPPAVKVHWSEVRYTVKFRENGLAPHTNWTVTIDGQLKSANTSSISFSIPNGTFAFSIVATGYTETSSPPSPLTVDGAPVLVTVTFSEGSGPRS